MKAKMIGELDQNQSFMYRLLSANVCEVTG